MILGGLTDSYGTLWRRQPQHVYFIEYTTKPKEAAVHQRVSCIKLSDRLGYDSKKRGLDSR